MSAYNKTFLAVPGVCNNVLYAKHVELGLTVLNLINSLIDSVSSYGIREFVVECLLCKQSEASICFHISDA